jgi:hypothetical protein
MAATRRSRQTKRDRGQARDIFRFRWRLAKAGDQAPALLSNPQVPVEIGGFSGPVAQPDRATVS